MKTYEKYKDSGVQWIGEIPSHWIVKRFKDCHFEIDNRVEERWSDFPLLSLSKKGVIPRDIDSGVGKFPGSFNDYKEVEPDDLIFCLYDIEETPRTVGLSDLHGMITGSYKVFRTNGVLPKYTYYVYLSIDDVKGLKPFYTGLRNVVRPETFKSLSFITPPLPEQHQIVSFLDEKTSLIDDLINKKEQKIGLLKEYRTSLINRVITKGLNPDCPMKDSGVEWIGMIPSHWKVSRIKYHYDLVSGFPFDSEDITNEVYQYPVIRIGNVSSGNVDVYFSGEPNEKHPVVRRGDLIVSLTGDFSIRQWNNVDSVLNQRCGLIRNRDSNVLDRVVFYQVPFSLNELGNTKYFTTLKNLSNSEFLDINLVVPPLSEQHQIVSFLDEKTSEINRTIQSEQKKIELLKEYRQSLISSVITGKIKVVN